MLPGIRLFVSGTGSTAAARPARTTGPCSPTSGTTPSWAEARSSPRARSWWPGEGLGLPGRSCPRPSTAIMLRRRRSSLMRHLAKRPSGQRTSSGLRWPTWATWSSWAAAAAPLKPNKSLLSSKCHSFFNSILHHSSGLLSLLFLLNPFCSISWLRSFLVRCSELRSTLSTSLLWWS